ncbi:unnamed protein product [Pylaiella littoralis]
MYMEVDKGDESSGSFLRHVTATSKLILRTCQCDRHPNDHRTKEAISTAHGRWACHRCSLIHWGVTSEDANWSQLRGKELLYSSSSCCADDAAARAAYGWSWLLMNTME